MPRFPGPEAFVRRARESFNLKEALRQLQEEGLVILPSTWFSRFAKDIPKSLPTLGDWQSGLGKQILKRSGKPCNYPALGVPCGRRRNFYGQ